MFCGLPLVMSTVRGAKDYLTEGESGFLCASEDATAFTGAIRRLKENPELRSRCGVFNRNTFKEFCLDQVKEEVLRLFKELE